MQKIIKKIEKKVDFSQKMIIFALNLAITAIARFEGWGERLTPRRIL